MNAGSIIGLILVFDGYNLFNAAYAAHYVAAQWQLSRTEIGTFLSSGLIGFAIGSLVHGPVADRHGRRNVMLAALWVASFVSLLIGVAARAYWDLCALRVLLGCSLGVLMPLSVTYLNEFTPKNIANTFTL